jgi:hypothetical protein
MSVSWASLKSLQRKEQEKQENGDEEKDRGNANVNFRGEKRSNQTQDSKTDPDAKLARKGDGKEAKLSHNKGYYTRDFVAECRNLRRGCMWPRMKGGGVRVRLMGERRGTRAMP